MLMAVLNCLFDSLSQMLRYVLAAGIYSKQILFFHKSFSGVCKAKLYVAYVFFFVFFHRKNVERRALLENMEGLFLAVDEIVDGGLVIIQLLETLFALTRDVLKSTPSVQPFPLVLLTVGLSLCCLLQGDPGE